jgi:cell division protein ZapB
MHDLRDLVDRIERLLLRHEELKRTNLLLTEEVSVLTAERDSLRSRLTVARTRLDSLIERLPTEDRAAGDTP